MIMIRINCIRYRFESCDVMHKFSVYHDLSLSSRGTEKYDDDNE